MRRKRPSDETLVALRGRLEDLPARSPDRRALIEGCADLHGVSADTVYRALRDQFPTALSASARPGFAAPCDAPRDGALLRADRGDEVAHHQSEGAASLDRPGDRAAGRVRGRNAGRAGPGAARPAHPVHGQSLSAGMGEGRDTTSPAAAG